MDRGADPFRSIFRDDLDHGVPRYLILLNPGSGTLGLLRVIWTIATTRDDAAHAAREYLAQPNWRAHLIAAAAAVALPEDLSPELWASFDAGSWVAPQLAAALYLCDPRFPINARERLERGCPVVVPEDLRPLMRHVATGPAGPRLRSAKNAAALSALVAHLDERPDWVSPLLSDRELIELIDADIDASAQIALGWLNWLREALGEQPG